MLPTAQDSILGVGAQQKATFAWIQGGRARVSETWNDLEDALCYAAYHAAIRDVEAERGAPFTTLAHDLHPEYLSTRYAKDRASTEGALLVGVQHHHAHMSACLLENDWTGTALGVVLDGTGYGTDGTIWGGEIFVGDRRSVERAAHLRSVAMPGGARAIREPWRMAFGHLADAGLDPDRYLARIPIASRATVRGMIEADVNAPLSSSCGRLFDAVAALLGLCDRAEREGQAPVALEALAATSGAGSETPCEIPRPCASGDSLEIDTRPLIRAVAEGLDHGQDRARLARSFHMTLAATIAQACMAIASDRSLEAVALSGGVFHNRILRDAIMRKLIEAGFRVLVHEEISTGDAGLSAGQLAVAAARQGVILAV